MVRLMAIGWVGQGETNSEIGKKKWDIFEKISRQID